MSVEGCFENKADPDCYKAKPKIQRWQLFLCWQNTGTWLNTSVNSAGSLCLPALPPMLLTPSRKSQTGRLLGPELLQSSGWQFSEKC